MTCSSLDEIPLYHRHAGLILAADDPRGLDLPLADLPAPGRQTLAQVQAELLQQAGCHPVIIVLSPEARVPAEDLAPCKLVRRKKGESGWLAAVQAAVRSLKDFDGCFILPVDTLGVKIETIHHLLEFAEDTECEAIRPVFHNQKGRLAWISDGLAQSLLNQKASSRLRLDDSIDASAMELSVTDSAILHRVESGSDWEQQCRRLLGK